jgi:hypothetical protein
MCSVCATSSARKKNNNNKKKKQRFNYLEDRKGHKIIFSFLKEGSSRGQMKDDVICL